MFEFANFLLLGLFAAGSISLLPVVSRKQSIRAWWSDEALLLGNWGIAYREKLGRICFYAALGLYEFAMLFCYSAVKSLAPELMDSFLDILSNGIAVLLAVKILLGTRYAGQNLLVSGILYFIARWVHFNAHYIWWIWLVFFILACKDVSITLSMKILLATGIPTFLLFSILWAFRCIPDYSSNGRMAFGTVHPNVASGILLGFLLAWLIIKRSRLSWGDIAVTGIYMVFCEIFPHSRTAFGAAAVLLVLLLIVKLLESRNRLRPAGRLFACSLTACVPLTCFLSFWLPMLFNDTASPLNPFVVKLNDTLTGRICLTALSMDYYPIKIAGQMLDRMQANDLYLDNVYAYMLYALGPVMLFLSCCLVMYAIYRYARMGQWVVTCCFIAMVAYSFAENQVLRLQVAPLNLLLVGAVFALPAKRWLPDTQDS